MGENETQRTLAPRAEGQGSNRLTSCRPPWSLPGTFHHTGPFHDGKGRDKVDFRGVSAGRALLYSFEPGSG